MSTKNIIMEYFNNNGKGSNSPYPMDFPNLNIKVEVYCHNLKPNKIAQIKSDIEETVNNFQNLSNLERSSTERVLKIYIFDDQADYKHLGSQFGFGLGDEGGKAYYRGERDVFAEMYVYQAGGIHNLKHELAHGLTYIATNGKDLPTILMEGVADYIEHSSDQNFNTQEGFSIDAAERAMGTRNLDINNILKLQYSENATDNSLVYKMGHALVMYLKEKGVLDDCLDAAKAGHNGYVEQLVRSNYNEKDFRDWLSQHNTETAMKEMNALQVTKGEFIGTKEEIVGGEIKNVSYYKANIEKMDGENVGKFSTTSHYNGSNHLYVSNEATRDRLDLSKQYSFMKLVNHNDKAKLVYCDKDGNEYKDSQEYINQVAKVAAEYDEGIKEVLSNLESKMSNASDWNSYEQAQKQLEQVQKNIVENLSGLPKDVVEELTYFDQNQVRDINKSHANFEYGKIYSVKSDGANSAKQINGISIYDGNNKIGELLTESGYFKSVEGKDAFFFKDDLIGLYTKYDNGAYIAVTKENGEFAASLIDGRAVSRDEYYNKPHLHRNELLEPSINHIKKEAINESLLLKGTEILDHSESEAAKIHTVVKRGELLDNKGTERTEDDVYEAKIEQDDFMYTFQNKGFYISREGDFFIKDHGKGVRYQLPKEITHLKLVEKNGVKKLVPVTKDGNENPYGMPSDITDEYRYIDPIFAHEFEKKDYSHKHTNIGLINFDKYRPGTMFEMKYDPNDYQIPRDANGNIIRLNHQPYFTKVKLFDDHGQEIGMLSNNFHNYTDKIFFSVDYNYSYTDFLASVAPQVNIKQLGNGTKVITFDQGKGDIGGTDRGYTDHQKIYTPENQKSQSYYYNDEQMQSDQPSAYEQNHIDKRAAHIETQKSVIPGYNKEFSKTNEKLNETINKGDVIIYRVKDNSNSDGEHSFTTFKMIKKSKLAETNNEKKSITLDLKDFDIKKVTHQDGIEEGDQLFYVIYKNDSSQSGFYNLGKDKIGFKSLIKSLEDSKYKCTYHDNIDDKFSISEQSNHKQQYAYYNEQMQSDQPSAYEQNQMQQNSGARGKRTTDNNDFAKQNHVDKSTTHTETQKPIVLNFEIEKGEPIKQHCFSAKIKLTEDSKNLLRDTFGEDVQFNNLDGYFNLDPKNFRISYNDGGGRYQLDIIARTIEASKYSKDIKSYPDFILGNHPLYGGSYFSVEISSNGSLAISKCRGYARDIIEDKFELLKTTMNNVLKDLLSNKDNLTEQDIYTQVFNEIAAREKEAEEARKESLKKYEELKEHIENGNIVFFEVVKGNDIGNGKSEAVLQLHGKSKNSLSVTGDGQKITLDPKEFYIAKDKYWYNDDDILYHNNHPDLPYKSYSLILNKNAPSNFDYIEGFYPGWNPDDFIKHSSPDYKDNPGKNSFTVNDILHDKLISSLRQDDYKQGLVRTTHDEQMQSDQPQIEKVHNKVSKNHVKHEDIVLKDTILSVSKSGTADKHGRYKAEIKIERSDIESLYNKSSGEEQQYVLKFWHALHDKKYKIGDLPGKQYYFKGDKFIIQDKQGKSIELPEKEISLQLMHMKDHQGKDHLELVVLDKAGGKVIGNIHEINDLSYGLLKSDSDILSHLEIQGHDITIHSSDYNTYLTHGLDGHVLGNHHGDHVLI